MKKFFVTLDRLESNQRNDFYAMTIMTTIQTFFAIIFLFEPLKKLASLDFGCITYT